MYTKIDNSTVKQTIETTINKQDLLKDRDKLEIEIINLQDKIKEIDGILKIFN